MLKLIDFYELTMSYSDFQDGLLNKQAYFDVFYRKNPDDGGYAVACGLDDIVDAILNFRFEQEDIAYLRSLNQFSEEFLHYLEDFRFRGDVYAIPDGTPVFPGEPVITVHANVIEAQLLETDILNRFNHGALIATKTRRIVAEAQGRAIMEFGARRAQGPSAACEGAKYAYIAGCVGTSCYATGKKYQIPVLGTMAHSHISKYPNEYEAFVAYAKTFPENVILLVDTYNTLKSGVPNAIQVAKDYLIPHGYTLKGIRLDSGDLAYLSKQARKMLDEAGLRDTKIFVSNSLDERLIKDLLSQKAPIDVFGVGENLITAKSDPVFGAVYKLAALEEDGVITPKIKLSDNLGKITNPGYKKVYRFYDVASGYALGDLVALHDETVNLKEYTLFDEKEPWKKTTLQNYTVKELQMPIIRNGKLVYQFPSLKERQHYHAEQMHTLYEEILRLDNPHTYYVDLSEKLYELKMKLIQEGYKR